MSAEKQFHISERNNCMWIAMPDSMNTDACFRFEKNILRIVKESGRSIVLDFARTSYLYSSGIGLLVRLRRIVTEQDENVYLVNVADTIRAILTSLNLDKVFPIYATDTEFEISHDSFDDTAHGTSRFPFGMVSQVEKGICRIVLTGQMTGLYDMKQLESELYREGVTCYVFDMSGVDIIDSVGLTAFRNVLFSLKDNDAAVIAYGARESVRHLVHLLHLDEFITFFDTERAALEYIEKK
jgi:anti-anti-sigma factor